MSDTPTPPETVTRAKGKPWSLGEAAAHLGVSVKHVRYLADTNKIATIRVGKRARRISDAEMTRVCREGV